MLYPVVVLCTAAAFVLSAPADIPLEQQQPTVIPIISQSEELEPNGTYKYSYETGNGIKREETSYDKVVVRPEGRSASEEGGESNESDEIHVQQGSYSYTAPDGTVITVRYIADENGFQAFGDHLPRAPAPLPVSLSSAEKSGRALKTIDSAEAASAPVSATKPESAPQQAELVPEPSQPAAEVKGENSESESAATAVEAVNPSEIEPKSGEVPTVQDQTMPADSVEQSSATVAVESAEQSAAFAAGQPKTEAAEQPEIAAEEQSSTAAAQESTTAADAQVTTAASAEVPVSEAANEQSASTIADEQLVPITEEQASTVAADTNAAVAEQPAPTVENDQSSVPNAADEQPGPTEANDQTLVTENAEESVPIPAADQQATTEASLQSSDAASTTASA